MKKNTLLLSILSLLLLCLSAACSDDDYHYPSVKLEFLTAYSGNDGKLSSVVTDDGIAYPVVQDDSNSRITADSLVRIISNYEAVTADDGTTGVRLYALSAAIAPLPRTADKFKEGVKNEPADIQSIWMGHDYLNMVLTVKQEGKHGLAFVEDGVEIDAETQTTTVRLTLYHEVQSTTEAYTKRAYLSIPLKQYATEGTEKVLVHFTLYTDEESTKTYAFTYTPAF